MGGDELVSDLTEMAAEWWAVDVWWSVAAAQGQEGVWWACASVCACVYVHVYDRGESREDTSLAIDG